MEFTNKEIEYIKEQLLLSKSSLDECCIDHIPIVDFISVEYAKSEYALIGSIIKKLENS